MLYQYVSALLTGREINFLNFFISICVTLFVVFCTMPVHEFAYAYAAHKLGDDTARLSGRLTLNPFAHIDISGLVLIVLFGFGYAKAVPVNPRNFKDSKKGMAVTAIAGPVSNLIMAFVFLAIGDTMAVFLTGSAAVAISTFFELAGVININLAVFNLLPIPPLDGSRILGLLVPDRYYYKIMRYERQIMLVIFVLLFLGFLTKPLQILSNFVYNGMNDIIFSILRLVG